MTMATPMRRIEHPGPVADQRNSVVAARVRRQDWLLPANTAASTLRTTLATALAGSGAASAVLTLGSGKLFPFSHVMPALSTSPEHAVYFSATFVADQPVQLQCATVTLGWRGTTPWLHCHATWAGADGRQHTGHLLPDDVVLATPLQATAWLLDGAAFVVQADDETRFTLFQPVALPGTDHSASATGRPALLVRLAPNEDVCTALESICMQHGITRAQVRGGVGSTVGAVFDDGRCMRPFVTETLVHRGCVRPGPDGQPQAKIDVSMVDHTGGQASGRLARGRNAVLVTFELVLEPD